MATPDILSLLLGQSKQVGPPAPPGYGQGPLDKAFQPLDVSRFQQQPSPAAQVLQRNPGRDQFDRAVKVGAKKQREQVDQRYQDEGGYWNAVNRAKKLSGMGDGFDDLIKSALWINGQVPVDDSPTGDGSQVRYVAASPTMKSIEDTKVKVSPDVVRMVARELRTEDGRKRLKAQVDAFKAAREKHVAATPVETVRAEPFAQSGNDVAATTNAVKAQQDREAGGIYGTPAQNLARNYEQIGEDFTGGLAGNPALQASLGAAAPAIDKFAGQGATAKLAARGVYDIGMTPARMAGSVMRLVEGTTGTGDPGDILGAAIDIGNLFLADQFLEAVKGGEAGAEAAKGILSKAKFTNPDLDYGRMVAALSRAATPEKIAQVAQETGRTAAEIEQAVKRAADTLFQATPEEVAQALSEFHGGPSGLDTLSATGTNGSNLNNAGSRFGAFTTPSEQEAQRYAEMHKGGIVYAAAPPKNPYTMPFAEYDYFVDHTKGPRNEDGFRKALPPDQWEARREQLFKEVAVRKAELQREGYDGIVVPGTGMRATETIHFNDVPVTPHAPTQPTNLPDAQAMRQPVDSGLPMGGQPETVAGDVAPGVLDAQRAGETPVQAGGRAQGDSAGAVKEPWQMTVADVVQEAPVKGWLRPVNSSQVGDYVLFQNSGEQGFGIVKRKASGKKPWLIETEGGPIETWSPVGSVYPEDVPSIKTRMAHPSAIEQALRDGKPVPPEVLADYPDLAKKYGQSAGAVKSGLPDGVVEVMTPAGPRYAKTVDGKVPPFSELHKTPEGANNSNAFQPYAKESRPETIAKGGPQLTGDLLASAGRKARAEKALSNTMIRWTTEAGESKTGTLKEHVDSLLSDGYSPLQIEVVDQTAVTKAKKALESLRRRSWDRVDIKAEQEAKAIIDNPPKKIEYRAVSGQDSGRRTVLSKAQFDYMVDTQSAKLNPIGLTNEATQEANAVREVAQGQGLQNEGGLAQGQKAGQEADAVLPQEEGQVGLRQRTIQEGRVKNGLEPVDKTSLPGYHAALDAEATRIYGTPDAPGEMATLAQDIVSGKVTPDDVSDVEAVMLMKHEEALREAQSLTKVGSPEHAALQKQIDDTTKASYDVGSGAGRSLGLRKLGADTDFADPASVRKAAVEVRWSKKAEVTPAQTQESARLAGVVASHEKKIADLEQKITDLFAKADAPTARATPSRVPRDRDGLANYFAQRKQSGGLYNAPRKGGTRSGAVSVGNAPQFSPDEARAVWEYAKENYIDAGNLHYTDMVKSVSSDLGLSPEEVQHAFASRKTNVRQMTDELLRAQYNRRRAVLQAKDWLAGLNTPPVVKGIRTSMDALRSIKVLGHANPMITHAGRNIFRPSTWADYWPAFRDQLRFFFKPETHELGMQAIENSDNYDFWLRSKLGIEPGAVDDYAKYGKLAEKVLGPVGEAGNRGMDAIKMFRVNLADRLISQYPKEMWDEIGPGIAEWVNHASGYAPSPSLNVGKFRLNSGDVLFAGSLESSRWAMFSDAAKTVGDLKSGDPARVALGKMRVKKATELAATYLSALAANQAMLKATGQEQNINFTDPTKSDWLKFKAGGHTIDPTGNMWGPMRYLAQVGVAFGTPLDKQPYYNQRNSKLENAVDATAFYSQGKLNPALGLGLDILNGQDAVGRPLPSPIGDAAAAKQSKNKAERSPQYTHIEFAWDQSPLPVAEVAKDVYADLREQGVPHDYARAFARGLPMFLPAAMGMHVGKEPNRVPGDKTMLQSMGLPDPQGIPDKRGAESKRVSNRPPGRSH